MQAAGKIKDKRGLSSNGLSVPSFQKHLSAFQLKTYVSFFLLSESPPGSIILLLVSSHNILMDSLREVHEVNAYGVMVGWTGEKRVRPTWLDESEYNFIFASILEGFSFCFYGINLTIMCDRKLWTALRTRQNTEFSTFNNLHLKYPGYFAQFVICQPWVWR